MKDSPENQGTHITLRPHHHHPQPPYSGGGGGREDCWSEDATATLIEAWGNRYLQLNRGNLRQKDWREVADAVNGRQDGIKPRKTDIQCKNRIDTVKKKYKIEKSKSGPSNWPFFTRLDHLIGTTTTPASNKKFVPTSYSHKSAVTSRVKPNPNPNALVFSGGSSSKSRLNSTGSTESSDDGDDDDDDNDLDFDGSSVRKHRMDSDSTNQTAFRELARAIIKFGEIYERIESSKQQQMMDLERQKMELTKDLEFQRMQMFMDTQIELEKKKRPKYSSGNGKNL